MGDAVAHCLDEDGLAAVREGEFASSDRSFSHGEDVVAVDADGINAVADTSAGYAVATVLFQRWCRDGEAVVPTYEDDGAGAGGGDVERGVEVALGGCSFAKVAGADSVGEGRVELTLQF